MQIDPRIALGVNPRPSRTRWRRRDRAPRRARADRSPPPGADAARKAANEAAIRNVMSQTGGDFDTALRSCARSIRGRRWPFRPISANSAKPSSRLKRKWTTPPQFDVGDRLLACA